MSMLFSKYSEIIFEEVMSVNALHKILALLWEKGIDEKEFCLSIGINKSAVTDWKKGKTASYKKHLPKIADFFSLPLAYFTDDKKPAAPEGERPALTEEERKRGEVHDLIAGIPPDKLDKVIAILHAAIDAVK